MPSHTFHCAGLPPQEPVTYHLEPEASAALTHFDHLATLARQAADRWAERFGPAPLVDAILGAGDAAGPPISFPSKIVLD